MFNQWISECGKKCNVESNAYTDHNIPKCQAVVNGCFFFLLAGTIRMQMGASIQRSCRTCLVPVPFFPGAQMSTTLSPPAVMAGSLPLAIWLSGREYNLALHFSSLNSFQANVGCDQGCQISSEIMK